MSPFPAFRSQILALLGRGEIPLWGDHPGPGGRSHAAPRPRQARLDGEPSMWPGRRRFPAPRWPGARLPNETPCTTELPLTPPRYKTPARRSPRTPGTARAAAPPDPASQRRDPRRCPRGAARSRMGQCNCRKKRKVARLFPLGITGCGFTAFRGETADLSESPSFPLNGPARVGNGGRDVLCPPPRRGRGLRGGRGVPAAAEPHPGVIPGTDSRCHRHSCGGEEEPVGTAGGGERRRGG
ncbi:protein S100-A14 isoform X1 [Corvus kubaryi]|uniref:protein S100-A14 isoform X1 n=1 Tax=Corvus kubaryi TaxID=68294 RepID=UPI001C03B60C|nr:protein S100-A14 isoform X1 [Corvus kubaryi]